MHKLNTLKKHHIILKARLFCIMGYLVFCHIGTFILVNNLNTSLTNTKYVSSVDVNTPVFFTISYLYSIFLQ